MGDPKLATLRAQLPAVTRTGYFNAGTNGPLPTVAHEALVRAAETELGSGRIAPGRYDSILARNAGVRALVAEQFGAEPAEIALTHSTSEGISIALLGLSWRRGDEVVTTNLEHPGLLAPLALLAHRFGVVVRTADLGDGGGDVLGAIEAQLSPRTRVVALSHVMWSTGAVVPLPEIAALAHRRGALVVVDGAQAAGHVPLDVRALGVDAYATSGQKWLCGPEGTGALVVRRDRLAEIAPTFLRYAQVEPGGFLMPFPGAARYEIGELYGPAVAAQDAALRWLRDEVGLAWACDRTAALGRRCHDGLGRIPGVTVVTPPGCMAGLVSFVTDGVPAADLVARLFERGHTLRSFDMPSGLAAARVSAAWWTTEEEVDALVAAVAEIAAGQTPSGSARAAR